MGVKGRLYLQLPYAIQLKDDKEYIYQFQFENFNDFEVKFYCNKENNNETVNPYNHNYDENFCLNIRIIATYNLLDSDQYEQVRGYNDEVKLPIEDINHYLLKINEALDKIFSFLREKTGMFWIEDLNITADNFLNNNILKYYFYSPNAKLKDNFIHIIDNEPFYASVEGVHKVLDKTFDDFQPNIVNTSHINKFLSKAKIAIYRMEFYNFVIYISISAEAFIREYIGSIEPSNDIIYNKLITINHDYVDLYYNVLLKYLKGKSLLEIYPAGYLSIKRAYNLRNAIMHSGKIDQKSLNKAGIIKLDIKKCEEVLAAFEKTRNVIEKL